MPKPSLKKTSLQPKHALNKLLQVGHCVSYFLCAKNDIANCDRPTHFITNNNNSIAKMSSRLCCMFGVSNKILLGLLNKINSYIIRIIKSLIFINLQFTST